MEGWRWRPAAHRWCRGRRRHACQSRQVGTGRSDDRRQGYSTSGGSPRGQRVYSETQVSPGESWRWLGLWRQVWSSPGWAKEGPGGRRGRSEHKPWGIDWNRQYVLSERLPRHRSFLRPLPHQGSRSCQPSSVKRWWPHLCGPESCWALWGRFERPGANACTATEATRFGAEGPWDRSLGWRRGWTGKDPQKSNHPEGHCCWGHFQQWQKW